jgi:large subunit ribosomal protein L19
MSNILITQSTVVVSQLRTDLPKFVVGSIVAIHYKYIDNGKQRVQVFKGLVTNLKSVKDTRNPKAMEAALTVTKTSVNGIKVERTFLLNSPFIEKILVLELRRSRRSNLRKLANDRKDYDKNGKYKTFVAK